MIWFKFFLSNFCFLKILIYVKFKEKKIFITADPFTNYPSEATTLNSFSKLHAYKAYS